MPKIRLTQAAVEKLRPPAAGRLELFDSLLPGFGLRVSETGAKSWFLFYRAHGRQRRYTIGTLAAVPDVADARDRARGLLRDVARGIDPAAARDAEPPPPPLTVAALVADFIARHAKVKNRAWRGTERLFALHVLPSWGERAAVSISRRDVRDLLDQIADAGHAITANRVLAAVRKMMNWAVERDLLPASPAAGIKPPGHETERERALADAELSSVWRAAERLGGAAGAFIRLLILTAQRRGEVAAMRWADLDLAARLWRLPREATKAARSHEVPLSRMAIEIIAALPRAGAFVFTTDGATHLGGFSKIKARIDALAAEAGEPPAPWRLHDLRRTTATGLATLGVPTSTISRVLNHAEGGVTKIYNRYGYLDEKRAALDLWARHVEGMLGRGEGAVIEMRRAR